MDEPWCLQPPDTFAGALFAQAFENSGLGIPKHVMTSSVHLQIGMLATRRYFTMLPGSLMRFIKALPIRLPVAPRPAGIVTVRNRTISPVARHLAVRPRVVGPADENNATIHEGHTGHHPSQPTGRPQIAARTLPPADGLGGYIVAKAHPSGRNRSSGGET